MGGVGEKSDAKRESDDFAMCLKVPLPLTVIHGEVALNGIKELPRGAPGLDHYLVNTCLIC